MMFCEKKNVTHTSLFCGCSPLIRIAAAGIEKGNILDTGCPFIEENLDFYENIKKLGDIAEVDAFLAENFPSELDAAMKLLDRLSWISLRLRQMEYLGEIEMPENGFSADDWEAALAKWNRKDLVPTD